MKITVWGINYAPELTGIAPFNTMLCEFLRKRGHDVSMLTGFQYYPNWRKCPDDCRRVYHQEVLNGVPVNRCWLYVPSKVSPFQRILHEASFVIMSMLRALFLPRADLYVIVSPPLGLSAM